MKVFACSAFSLAKKIAKKLDAKFSRVEVKYFPDNEVYLRFKERIDEEVILVQSLAKKPNERLVELIFSSLTAKDLGARKVIALIPYLAYMRQDKRFKKGECISARVLAEVLQASGIDALFTLNPHLHRIKSLSEIYRIPVFELSCERELARYIQKNFSRDEWVLVGPDIESTNFVRRISRISGFDYFILRKRRISSKKVRIFVSKLKPLKKNAIIIDDILSTGETLIKTIQELKKLGFKKFFCIVVHLLSEKGLKKVEKFCKVVSTNSVPSRVSKIDVSEVFSLALKRYLTEKPIREIDELF